jgi:hypothetical protein
MSNSWAVAITAIVAFVILNGARLELVKSSTKSKHPAVGLWLAFAASIICGGILAVGLYQPLQALTSLTGGASGLVGSVGILMAVWFGMHSAKLIIAAARDLSDKRPDQDARSAALIVPSMLPAGWTGLVAMINNPSGFTSGTTAVLSGVIVLFYSHSITKAALASGGGKSFAGSGQGAAYSGPIGGGPGSGGPARLGGGKNNNRTVGKWVSAAVCLLAGVMLVPTIAALDAALSGALPATIIVALRVIGGTVGLALGVAATCDILDHEPDKWVRGFLAYGVPLVTLFGSLSAALVGDGANNLQDLLRQIGG